MQIYHMIFYMKTMSVHFVSNTIGIIVNYLSYAKVARNTFMVMSHIDCGLNYARAISVTCFC